MPDSSAIVPVTDRTVSDSVMIALRKIIQAIDTNSKQLVKRVGLTGPQLVILQEITRMGEVTAGEIAQAVSLSQATVTGILERMEKRGLLARRRSETDKRRIMVRITRNGQQVLDDAPPLMQEAFVERFSDLQEWEQTMILSALQRLVSIMDAKAIQAAPFLATSPIDNPVANPTELSRRHRSGVPFTNSSSRGIIQVDKIVVENLYKIFGDQPKKAMQLLKEGHNKESVHDKTGMTVGVDNASFSIEAGEIFVIMGLSGSGKSTIVRMLNRLIEPTAGKVIVDGKDVIQMGQDELVKFRLHNMSMVFQSFALMPHLTVLDNAAFGLDLAKTDNEKRKQRAMEALEQVGLAGWENSYPKELSGGMQQRVGLARGLAVDPDILLMDEAFSALDPLIRTEMQDELLKLQEEDQRTIVFISHDLDEALRIGDRIAIMEGGRVVQVGPPEEILQNPADDYVRAFFRGVDPTNVISAGDIVRDTHPTIVVSKKGSLRACHELLSSSERDHLYVLDPKHRFLGIVSSDSLREALESGKPDNPISQAYLENGSAVTLNDSMQDILPQVASSSWPIPVVDDQNVYKGVVSKNRFLRTLHRTEESMEAYSAS